MLKSLFRLLLRLAVVSAVIYAGRRALKSWVDGPEPLPSTTPWPAVATPASPAPPATTEPAVVETAVAEPAAVETAAVKTDAVKTAAVKAKAPARKKARTDGAAWVAPAADGSAPPSHPVKVKMASGLYRVPGTAAYDRTRADRCYATPEAAEADGFTRAKR